MGLEDLCGRIEKRFGKEAVVGNKVEVETITSGSMALDDALGGGWAVGRIHEIYGGNSSGKTTAALHLCRAIQQSGRAVGFVDTEQALDLEYATNLGVSLEGDKWIMSQPDSAEQAMEIVREMIEEPAIGLVVLDSVAGLCPQAILQGEAGDAKVALVARLMSSQLNILKSKCNKNKTILLCLNQIRNKIGGGFGFGGSSSTTPGGEALKFYATQRVEFSRIGTDKDGDIAVANKTKIKVVKNKIAPPFRTCELMLRFGIGFDRLQETIELAVKLGICQKRGSWFYYGEDYKLGQGMDKVRETLMEDKELFEEIYETTKKSLCTQAE